MAVWTCADCTADYAVGAPECPQCGSVVRIDERPKPREEDTMAKITVHGGVTNAAADEGGEDVSAGTSSSTSSEKESSTPEPSETQAPSPAPTTASRSSKGRTAKRTARGTAGAPEAGTSETSSADE